MTEVHQGEILWLEKDAQYILVLSRQFFNQSGMAVVCPLMDQADPDVLHFEVTSERYFGIALVEHLRSLDLQARHFRRITRISYDQIQDISDAVQGIFEYYPLSI